MKKLLAFLLCLLLPFSLALAEEGAPQGLSYEASEFPMAAIGYKLYIPADMTGYGSDMSAYDMGFRFNIRDDAMGFELDGSVECGHDMTLPDFAAYFAQRNDYGQPVAGAIDGCAVQTMTSTDDPTMTVVLLGGEPIPEGSSACYYYMLAFVCESAQAEALKEEILSTLTVM